MGQISRTKAHGVAMALVVGFGVSTAWAAKPDAVSLDEEPAAEASATGTGEAEPADVNGEAVDKDTAQETKTVNEEAPVPLDDKSSPVEKPGETYYFVGARYRGIILPQFMMNMFADGGQTIYVNGVGAEFGIRKDDFEFLPSVWYAGYGADDMPFKSKTDPDSAWELVDSSIKVLYLTADFLWSKPINKQFAINYGAGAGFGFVFGDITRQNAFFPNGTPNSNGDGLVPCGAPRPGNPSCPA